ncbi:MAG: ribbon-helix-helix protein, CopG family [Nitrospiraceae bacterium]
MPISDVTTNKDRAYRRRLAAEGRRQLIVALPQEMITAIDELKHQRGLKSRSQVLMELIERGRQPAQQIA